MRSLTFIAALILSPTLFNYMPAASTITCGDGTDMTVEAGLSKLQPGDTLVIQPGLYRNAVTVPCDSVTIEGAAAGVIFDGSVQLTQADLSIATGRPGVFTWQLPAGTDPRVPWVFVDGQPLNYTKAPLDPAKQAWSFYVNQNTKQLEVVFDGKEFPTGKTLVVPVQNTMIQAWDHPNVTIKGLEVDRSSGCGISCGVDGIAEDNLVTWTGGQGIVGRDRAIIRRNTIKNCNGPGVVVYGNGLQVENNLIVACGVSLSDYLSWMATETKLNAQSNCTFQQNWLVDRPKGGLMQVDGNDVLSDGKPVVNKWVLNTGFWTDVDCYQNSFIDNCVARLSHSGAYIEYNCDRNTVAENDIQDCAMGITMREASNNVVVRNWVWDHECLGWGTVNKQDFAGFGPGYDANGNPFTKPYIYDGKQINAGKQNIVDALGSTTWGHQLDDGLCLWHTYQEMVPPSRDNVESQNLVQVSGVAVSVPLGDHDWPSAAERGKFPRDATLSNQLIGNFYTRPSKPTDFALLGRTNVRTFAEYRKLTNWDSNSHVGQFTPAVLGLEPIWTIPAYAVNTMTAVSILHDPSLETTSLMTHSEPLFWHGTDVHDWLGDPDTRYLNDAKLAHSGECSISATNVSTATATPIWWTSSSIPVKEGITMGVQFWVAADGVHAGTAGGGVDAKMQFADVTGHLVTEVSIIGDGIHPELMTGEYPYTFVSGTSAVPKNACWMTVLLGEDPSTGRVRFDDIHMSMVNPAPPIYSAEAQRISRDTP